MIKKKLSFLIDWSKHIDLPGFKGMNLYEVSSFFIKGLEKGAITTRASSIAFNFFLALFPALIFFFTLIPTFPSTIFKRYYYNCLVKCCPLLPTRPLLAHSTISLVTLEVVYYLWFSTGYIFYQQHQLPYRGLQ